MAQGRPRTILAHVLRSYFHPAALHHFHSGSKKGGNSDEQSSLKVVHS